MQDTPSFKQPTDGVLHLLHPPTTFECTLMECVRCAIEFGSCVLQRVECCEKMSICDAGLRACLLACHFATTLVLCQFHMDQSSFSCKLLSRSVSCVCSVQCFISCVSSVVPSHHIIYIIYMLTLFSVKDNCCAIYEHHSTVVSLF